MLRRSLFKLLIASACIAAAPLSFALDAGKDYTLLQPAQPGGANGQIEVIEFFSYGCPHCSAFDPKLSKWRAAQSKDVVFKRVPVSFGRPEWAALGRLYITLNTMGLSDKYDSKVFDGVHKEYLKLQDEKVRNDWLTKEGIDVKKFNDTWRSFGVETQMRRADQMAETYRVQGVPMLIVDGKYIPTDSGVQGEEAGHSRVLVNADQLVAKARAEKPKK
ncbi:MAG TPA: thiol:disulfide interchange protein DsbA/DsbL [Rhodocyclaceae bacterium]|nr:thiol:disulfide interchange protein DsbA/DsbL [Rhodocyclaceae bacterium]